MNTAYRRRLRQLAGLESWLERARTAFGQWGMGPKQRRSTKSILFSPSFRFFLFHVLSLQSQVITRVNCSTRVQSLNFSDAD